MKFKNGWNRLLILSIFFAAFTAQASHPAEMPAFYYCSCDAPASITVTSQTDDTVSFSWTAASGATGYRVWYVRSDDNYTSSFTTVSGTSMIYSGLPPGRYTFHVATICGSTESEGIILEDLLMG